jgi:hypothetical protein
MHNGISATIECYGNDPGNAYVIVDADEWQAARGETNTELTNRIHELIDALVDKGDIYGRQLSIGEAINAMCKLPGFEGGLYGEGEPSIGLTYNHENVFNDDFQLYLFTFEGDDGEDSISQPFAVTVRGIWNNGPYTVWEDNANDQADWLSWQRYNLTCDNPLCGWSASIDPGNSVYLNEKVAGEWRDREYSGRNWHTGEPDPTDYGQRAFEGLHKLGIIGFNQDQELVHVCRYGATIVKVAPDLNHPTDDVEAWVHGGGTLTAHGDEY